MSPPLDAELLMRAAPFLPIEMDPEDGRVLRVGAHAESYLGVSSERWLEADFWTSHVLPDDQLLVRDARLGSAGPGPTGSGLAAPYSAEYRMERPDGRIIWTWELGRRVSRADGQSVLIGYLIDVTERKRHEVALWKSEERLRGVLQRAPDAMILTELDGRIVNMNDQAQSLLGYALPEVVGSSVDHLVPDSLRAELGRLRRAFERDSARRSLVHGHAFTIERSDGTEVPVEWSMSLVPGLGERDQILSSVRDLTARRRVEAQFRSHALRPRETADIPAAMFCAVDLENRYRFANEAYAHWFGCKQHQIGGRAVREVVGESSFARMQPAIEAALAGEATHVSDEITNTAGDRLPVAMNFVPQHDDEGRVAGYLVAVFDVSDQVAAMEADRRHREELYHVARLATMGELAASIAHELNQPLSAIMANADAGRRLVSATPPELDELDSTFTDIAADGRRAAEVIASMRQLLQHGESAKVALDPVRLVADVVELVRSEAIGRGVTVHIEPGGGDEPEGAAGPERVPFRVLGDATQLKQVVLNLLMNAIEAAGRGSAEPRRVSVTVDRAADHVEVTVRDSGPGLPKGDPEELFMPFVSKRAGGLGLGLSISRTIVDAHGGRLRARSDEPTGAAFTLSLPTD